jgi:hypothetical protein
MLPSGTEEMEMGEQPARGSLGGTTVILVMFALLGLLAATGWGQAIDISGVVKDAASGDPLPGFVVSLSAKGLQDTTNDKGEFHLRRTTARLADRSPLRRLVYSAGHGFAMRLTQDEDITAEIRNGAGRTLVHGMWAVKAGDWSLKPRNLEPGLYTVMLWTGSRLRALRLTIAESGKERGKPAWLLSELSPEQSAEALAPPMGVAVDSLRLVKDGWQDHQIAVQSWSQGGITILPKRLALPAASGK